MTDHDDRLIGKNAEVDVFSWDHLLKIQNPADYDAWVLNIAAVQAQVPPKLFTTPEIQLLFAKRTIGHIIANGGTIFLIGDLPTGIATPPSTGGTSPPKGAVIPKSSPYHPFSDLIAVSRDPRPVDYRRISKPEAYRYERIYDYLDQVTKWDYSFIVKEEQKPFEVMRLAATNFGTCLAAQFKIGSGSIFVLPSLGAGVEADDSYLLQHFLGVRALATAPQWTESLIVPEQRAIEARCDVTKRSVADLIEQLKREKAGLVKVQRWKRLLYDDGFGLEEIVKEAFETLGAVITKPSKEKADFRMAVAGRPACVLEIKGSRKDQFLRKDLRQLSEWMDEAILEGFPDVKGVFVGNAAREKQPLSRGSMFDLNNLAFAGVKTMILVRALDLYCLVILQLTGQLNVEQFWNEFFSCSGEFDAGKYWQLLPTEFSVSVEQSSDAAPATQ